MLEVGCDHGPGGEDDPGLSYIEARTHFGAWCIVSSPLILSHDTTDDAVTDEIWPIISNTEAIAVNAAWDGDSGKLDPYLFTKWYNSNWYMWMWIGSLFKESDSKIVLHSTSKARGAQVVASWQQWSKRISANSAAVLVMNNDEKSQPVTIDFNTIPTFASDVDSATYKVRDIWTHADLGDITSFTTVTLESHDSAFYVITRV